MPLNDPRRIPRSTEERTAEKIRSLQGQVKSLERRGAQWPTTEDVENRLPPGSIILNASFASPSGFIPCRGQVVPKSQFVSLFQAIGDLFNTGGEAATEFRLPDLTGLEPAAGMTYLIRY